MGQPPLLFQTYTVHESCIKSIMLSEKFLISGLPLVSPLLDAQ